jgi:50S ribosomal protein L16 3-hydroxylase
MTGPSKRSPPLERTGTLAAGAFLRDYWQRRPLLLRQACPASALAIDARRLFDLARRDDIESRLVTAFHGRWQLRHGPIGRREVPPRDRRGWTLLVQGVDQVEPVAAAILARFRFLSDARLDDVMLSFASDHGGVGPHRDSYDVFLIQVAGRRRWRIDPRREDGPAQIKPGLPLRILARFEPTASWVLEPGDMLYLPPGVAHEGVALGESITCSVGARAPAWQELVEPWHLALADATTIAGRYRDPLEPTPQQARRPARLPPAFAAAAFDRLAARRPTRTDATRLLLAYLTEPKAQVVFDRPARPLAPAAFAREAARRGLRADPRSRILYAGSWLGINGELLALPAAIRPVLQQFADRRALARAPAQAALDSLRIWYLAGWIHLGAA